jgi:putative DNA primase/helicase
MATAGNASTPSSSPRFDPAHLAAALPFDLVCRPQWVGWRSERRAGKVTKVPYSPLTGGRASTTDPDTWGGFVQACDYATRASLDGIGHVFAGDVVGVDLDHCRDPQTGAIQPWAQRLVDRLDSYAEVSPSGTGLHLLLAATLPGGKGRRKDLGVQHVEVYGSGRFFTCTGDHLAGTPRDVLPRQEALDALYDELFGPPAPAAPPVTPIGTFLDDDALVATARAAANGAKFARLWAGHWTGDYGSASEADAALCGLLAFWTGRDLGRMDTLFRRSGLYRPKWDEHRGAQTYGAQTLAGAVATCGQTYHERPRLTLAEMGLDGLATARGGRGHCVVCAHPERDAIDAALCAGATHRELTARYHGISRSGLGRHAASHVGSHEVGKETGPQPTQTGPPQRESGPETGPPPIESGPRWSETGPQTGPPALQTGPQASQSGPPPAQTGPLPARGAGNTTPPARGGSWLTKHCADALGSYERFASDAGDRLHVYRSGVYRCNAERFVGREVQRLLDGWKLGGLWSTHLVAEVCAYLALAAPTLEERPRADVLNVGNGLVEVATNPPTLRPHDPDYLTDLQVPVRFDPQATCPAWERFMGEVFPVDCVAAGTPWQLAALLLLPTKRVQRAVLLTGVGSNGKSTVLRAYRALLGRQNTCALSLHQIEQDRFAGARLAGKLANICPDLPTTHLESSSAFKTIVDGDDGLSVQHKFQRPFDLYPFCRLVFSANHPPRSADSSEAFFRRWLVIPFARQFDEGAAGTRDRDALDAELADPRELSGVLNKAFDVLPALRRHGITQTPSMQEAWSEFRAATDPLAVWLDQETVDDPQAVTPRVLVRQAYRDACRRDGRPVLSDTAFGLGLKRFRPQVRGEQRHIAGRDQWCYGGLGLRQPAASAPSGSANASP